MIGMELNSWQMALFILGIAAVAMLGAGWSQYLEHQRRKQAMDIIKAALEAGKEAPPIVYDQIAKAGESKPPWGEVVVFTALSFAFWIAYSQAPDGENRAYLIVASTMTVTAIGCLALAIMRPDRGSKSDDDGE